MSQILEKPKTRQSGLIQDVYFENKKPYILSSALMASCYVCGKGLEDGHSLTAKTVRDSTVLLCDIHVTN